MVKFTLRNAAKAVSDVRFDDEGQVRYVFLSRGRQVVDGVHADLFKVSPRGKSNARGFLM